jgi:sterol desaturase/sphingolipid hydroxylase (fatty acid hydroxylase superfamily)
MLNIFFSIISYDIWFYLSHVLLHSKSLYKFHKEHHKKIYPKFLDTYTGHFLEGPFQGLGMLLPFIYFNYNIYDILIVLSFLNIRGMMRHDIRFAFLIGNHHLLHHRYPKYNYGEYWLDYMFGTKYPNDVDYQNGIIYL